MSHSICRFNMSSRLRKRLSSWRKWTKQCIAIILVMIFVRPPVAMAADRTEIATSALEFGGSIGKLLWVAVEDHSGVKQAEADQYTKLASQIREQIDVGRASSSLVRANFKVVGTTLAYAAAVDPEPVSKAVSGFAAWGAKKTGDALGQLVIDKSQEQARAILAQGLKNSGLSEAQLKKMTASELRSQVADLKVGGQTLREVLKDDPDSLSMLQAHATDIATHIGVEALARSEGTAADVKTIQQDLANTNKTIADYQDEVKKHLVNIDSRISGLEDATRIANQKLNELKTQVQGQSKAIQTLAQISYSGWTTAQKIQGVKSGVFSDLNDDQKKALLESLRAEKAREEAVAGIQQAARDFGNLAAIASHIGLSKELVTGLQGAQNIATGIAQFATGDALGGLASITSLVGLGAGDAAAERHAAMMKYLEGKFAEVNKKLDEIIKLQVETLKAVAALAKEQRQFRQEVLGQLDRIENIVLGNQKLLQAILLSQWEKCHALINGPLNGGPLNGQFNILTRDALVRVIGNPNIGDYSSACYSKMASFLDASVKPAKWSGQIIDADSFPSDSIAAEPALQKSWSAFQAQRISAYTSARDFVLDALPEAANTPAPQLARFSQPVVDIYFANQLDSAMAKEEIRQRFVSFKCNEADVVSPALRELLCFGVADGTASAPLSSRWQDVLSASLIGPYSTGLIDTGIALATISDFARKNDHNAFVFVKPKTIANFSRDGATPEIRAALEQHKGAALLEQLRWLAEAYVLQQSITYGDYTAQLVEKALYDPSTRSLNTDPKFATKSSQQKALSAMRANPLLARNVVMLAMRHAITDGLADTAKAEKLTPREKAEKLLYRQSYYARALHDFSGPQACDGSPFPREKLAELFPNWRFEYWVTSDQQKDNAYSKCPNEFKPDPDSPPPQLAARGSGVGVVLADFYVLVPSPLELSTGAFEQSDSLRLALFYRDRLSQAIIDRNVGATVRDLFGNGSESKTAARIPFMLLNEGWDWHTRPTSK